MKFSVVTIASSFLLFIASVAAEDYRREVYTLSVFCDAWNRRCASIAHRTGNVDSYCEPGYDGNGTASAFCTSLNGSIVTDYSEQVISSLHATQAL
ncbi:hypothetical protein BT96DRAFT_920187 [Gymnopus androsaceus JB14]|uniref:Uncharacterized protein n=1 Tax=Gymnopus androsaceus JB14 TaxID=1447944 RepID=A0A6A4HR02_9AGAR|nr:hypothetical protein BT96DRAFT_920187 [Gymnopus androsaceus JB14]